MVESFEPYKHPDPDALVWRYMDFTRFVSILETSSLYFNRLDKFEDPFEGELFKSQANLMTLSSGLMDDTDDPSVRLKGMMTFHKNRRKTFFVNCWHENKNESAAMWSLYTKNLDGICIQISFGKLYKSLHDLTGPPFFLGRVKYVDFANAKVPGYYEAHQALFKRESFSHENEIRAVLESSRRGLAEFEAFCGISNEEFVPVADGFSIPIELNQLITKIYVAPNAPKWFFDLVRQVVKRYGYDFEIQQSDLYDALLY